MTEEQIIEAWAWVRKNNNSIPDDVLDFMKDSAIAALQNKGEWISVEDKKQSPNEGDYVLVNIGKNIILKGRRMINGWTAFFADGEKLCDAIRPVTHWQPLPTPPEQTVTQ